MRLLNWYFLRRSGRKDKTDKSIENDIVAVSIGGREKC